MKISKIVFLILSFLVSSVCAMEDCVFLDAISGEDYASSNLISNFQWSEKDLEIKGVLNTGELFSIKHWSCSHRGTHAVLFVGPYFKEIPEKLNGKILQLAEVALGQEEKKLLSDAIKNENLMLTSGNRKIVVPSDEYSEFYVSYNVSGEIIMVEIKLYQN